MKRIKENLARTLLAFFAAISLAVAQSDLTTVKERVVTESMKSSASDAEIEELINTLQSDGTWPGIDYHDVSREGFEHRNHLSNMLALAQSYKTQSSKFYKRQEAKRAVEGALKHWVNNDYICDNWWHNQIGTPGSLVTLMLVLGNELPTALVEKARPIIGRAHIDASGARPGGDRIKIAGIEAKNMLFLGNEQRLAEVVDVIEGEIHYVPWIGTQHGYGYRRNVGGFANRSAEGRGIQYDNSFHHRTDGVNNTLSYGLGYAAAFAEWATYTDGTHYSFSEEKLAQLIDYFLDGICKTAVYGKYPDAGAKNRSISREGTLHPYDATMAEALLLTSDYRKDELQEIAAIRSKGIQPTTSHATFFWHSEHFAFQRPDFFTSVRMYSTRNHNMEVPYNSEGLLNHHRGDGVNHISRTGDEYYDIWPVYDYQKIPGTTIMQKPELPTPDEIAKLGSTEFVGAVTDGRYAAAAFDFKSPHDPLVARKSWFFFDEQYVCLGASISCPRDLPVVTTLNQCLLRDAVTVSRNNATAVIEPGELEFEQVDWVFQDSIGYVFPQPTKVSISNKAQTGSWWRINKQSDSPKEQVSRDVFTLWLNHGDRPSDASYEYIVVPATSIEKLQQNRAKEQITVLSNTAEIQAVKNTELNIYQAVFYQAGEIQLAENLRLISDQPGIVMVKTEGEQLKELSVADPNRTLRKMHISLSATIKKQGEAFTSVWNEVEKTSAIAIDLPQGVYAGKSVTIAL